jgi:MFS family permease
VVRQTLFSRWFALVFFAALASELSNALLVHFPGFLLDLGASESGIGAIVGVAGVAAIAARPFIGRVMDRRSRRLLVRVGTLTVVMATLGYAFVDTLGPMVITARLLQGLGQAMTMTAFWAHIADRIPAERRAQGIALFGISGLAPIGVAPALGDAILGTEWGYQGLFVVAAAFSLAAFGLSMLMEPGRPEGGESPTGFVSVLRTKELQPVWLATVALSLGFTTAFIFVKTYAATSGLGSIGPFFAAYSVAAVSWRLGLGWVPDRVGPVRMVAPSLVLYATGLATIGLVPGFGGLIAGGALTGLGHGIGYPVMLTLATARANVNVRGTVTALFIAVFDLVLFAIPPLIGLTIELAGYPPMFVGVAGLVIVGMLAFYAMERRRHLRSPSLRDEPATAPIPYV